MTMCVCLLCGCIPEQSVHEEAGHAFYARQKYGEAVFEYTLALREGPIAGLYVSRGLAWEGLDRLDEAIRDLDAAIRMDPGYAEAYQCRAEARMKLWQRRSEEEPDPAFPAELTVLKVLALADLDRAVELQGAAPDVMRARAYARFIFGDYQGVVQDISRVLRSVVVDGWAYDLRGRARQKTGDWKKSVEDFSMAILVTPWDAGLYARRGFSYAQEGRWPEAEVDLSRSIGLDSLQGAPWFDRALVRLFRNDTLGACSDACRACSLGVGEARQFLTAFACECP